MLAMPDCLVDVGEMMVSWALLQHPRDILGRSVRGPKKPRSHSPERKQGVMLGDKPTEHKIVSITPWNKLTELEKEFFVYSMAADNMKQMWGKVPKEVEDRMNSLLQKVQASSEIGKVLMGQVIGEQEVRGTGE